MNMERAEWQATWVWLGLVALSIVTWLAPEFGLSPVALMGLTLGLALLKSQWVADGFMGLARVGGIWRAIMLGYLVTVGALIATAFTL